VNGADKTRFFSQCPVLSDGEIFSFVYAFLTPAAMVSNSASPAGGKCRRKMVDILLQSNYETLVPLPKKGMNKDISPLICVYFHRVSYACSGSVSFTWAFPRVECVRCILVEPGINHESFSGAPEVNYFRSGGKESRGSGSKQVIPFRICVLLIRVKRSAQKP
jgi:hypothetical protein